MINKIWGFFIVSGILFSIITGRVNIINNEIIKSAELGFDMCLKMIPVMALWLGIMNIAKISGLLQKFSKLIYPVLSKIFPEIPKNHESLSLIASNIAVNMMGLGSVATPIGIKAMHSLQQLNKKKDTASKSMITFLVINTGGITIVPTAVISLRMFHNSNNPTEIILASVITTTLSLFVSLILNYFFARRDKNEL